MMEVRYDVVRDRYFTINTSPWGEAGVARVGGEGEGGGDDHPGGGQGGEHRQ